MSRRSYQQPVSEMSGYKTLVTPSGEKGLPSRTDKKKDQNYRDRPGVPSNNSYKEQALPITPKHEKNRERHQPTPDEPSRKPEFNTPPSSGTGQTPDGKSLSKDRARTKSKPGDEYGHPYLDQGDAGMKGRRPLQGRQREQGGKAQRVQEKWYRKHKMEKQRDSRKWYRGEKPKGDEKLRRKRYVENPDKYKRLPGGYRDPAERSRDWRKENPTTDREADFYMERGNPSQDSETYYDRGRGYDKKRKQWDERHEPAPGQLPSFQVVNNPGSAKVIPEGHDFANKEAALISDIEARCDEALHQKARGIRYKLTRVNARHAMWTFSVQGSKGPYKVRVKAPRRGNVRDVKKLNVYVSCSCPYWRWQGPEHWAKLSGYLYGKPRGTASVPHIKDPAGIHGACKHVLAVLGRVKEMGTVKPQWGKKGSLSPDLQYLADTLSSGEMEVLSVKRVAARYLRQVIHQTRRGE